MAISSFHRRFVLIVDDEPLLRMTAADFAEEAGYEVLEANNADEALTILGSRDDIAIIFTDIEMPGSMNGLKLAAAVKDRWPPIAIVVVSGRQAPSAAELPSGALFFAKPFQSPDIVNAFRDFRSVS